MVRPLNQELSHVDTAPPVHDNGFNFTSHRGNFHGRQRGQFRGKYRNDFTPQQALKKNCSRNPGSVGHFVRDCHGPRRRAWIIRNQ